MQDLVTNVDFVVCLTLETTLSASCNLRRLYATAECDRLQQLTGGVLREQAPAIPDLGAFFAINSNVVPRVIHVDWCVCTVNDFRVLESAHAFVNPGVPIDGPTTAQTKVTQDIISQEGVSFA